VGTPRYTITLQSAPDAAAEQVVRDGLSSFNRAQIGIDAGDDYRPLSLYVRSKDGTVLGGLLGGTYWGWLAIHILWLDEALRGQNYGTDLLQMAEREAIKRGCHRAYLDTMSFQASGFCERQGYRVVAELPDFPDGYSKIIMAKQLSAK
jgi:GNAT superfamily N-acetyltransferase